MTVLIGIEKLYLEKSLNLLGVLLQYWVLAYTAYLLCTQKKGIFDESKVEAYLATITNPEIDLNHIRRQYPIMGRKLVDLFTSRTKGQSELFFYEEVLPGIGVGGSIDLLCPSQVVDYKTTGSLSAPDKIRP